MASTINAKNTSTGVVITPDASGQLELQTADTTRMTITSGGNVGIGTSSPTSALVVSGTISGSPTVDGVHLGTLSGYAAIELCGTSGTGSVVDFTKSGSDNLGRILYDNTNNYMAINTNSLERMRIDSSGNVGIGTSSPTQSLTVNGRISISTLTSLANIDGLYSATGIGTILNTGSGNNIAFVNGTTERMRIDGSGYVMINSTSATLAGANNHFTIKATDIANTAYGIGIQNLTNNTGGRFINFVNSSNTAIGNINQNATTTVAYSTTSDYRLKENVQPMVGALDKVVQLNPVTYTWKEDGSDGQGFIAHELQAVVPDCVSGEKDAVDADGNPIYQGVDTSFLVATLTAAIQELKAELDTVKAELATLKGEPS